ncbi:MAG: hypothetical protein GWN86_07090 [Desulfobacterales bacterium]|nr:hypothetical protein [Desulfobacterales bacterium]
MATRNKVNQDTVKIENGRLIIDVAIDPKGTPSASGKTLVNFTTHGAIDVDGSKLNITLYTYPKR